MIIYVSDDLVLLEKGDVVTSFVDMVGRHLAAQA